MSRKVANIFNKQINKDRNRCLNKYFGIFEYTGTQKQCEDMASQITKDSFEKSLNKVNTSIHNMPSSTIRELKDKILKDGK